MPVENNFRALLRQHMQATRANKFGQFGHGLQGPPTPGRAENTENGFHLGQIPPKDYVATKGTFAGPYFPDHIIHTDFFRFQFNVTDPGDATGDLKELTSILSETPPGNTPAIVAARFFGGAGGSSFGATVADPDSATIVLSDAASANPEVLDASIEFTDLVEFDVVNNTVDPNESFINEIYFNSPDGLVMTLSSVTWRIHVTTLDGEISVENSLSHLWDYTTSL